MGWLWGAGAEQKQQGAGWEDTSWTQWAHVVSDPNDLQEMGSDIQRTG